MVGRHIVLMSVMVGLGCAPLQAQRAGDGQAVEAADGKSGVALVDRQSKVAQQFQRLEELLLRLAEMETAENPERAALLRRAAKQSRETFILDRLGSATEALRVAKFQQAIDDQKLASENLEALLKLLLTEDRPQRIRDEKERITNWIKDLKRQERRQRATRARTENKADLEEVEAEQRGITEQADRLREEMAQQDRPAQGDDASAQQASPDGASEDPAHETESPGQAGEDASSADSGDDQMDPRKQAEREVEQARQEEREALLRLEEAKQDSQRADQSGETESQAAAEAAQQAAERAAEQAEQARQEAEARMQQMQDAAHQPSEPDPPSDSQSSPGAESSSEAEQQESPQQTPPQTPEDNAQQRLQRAVERMEQAQQNLEQAKREEAVENQRKAEEELRQAIDQLERILRQLREEEMQRELARLESRVRKMAQMQAAVLERTQELSAIPQATRDRQTDLRAGNLAGEQRKIVMEADRAMLLLREEGSSVAFPEVMQQVRGDMQTVADRLSQTKIDGVTQGIQEDILAALEEMVQALQQAQRDLEEQRQQQQQDQQPMQQGDGEQPLVDALAELKLLRTMQTRVKNTTERYDTMLREPTGDSPGEIAALIRNLAERQNRLYSITRDLVLRRNQ